MDESVIIEKIAKLEARQQAMADRIDDVETKVEDIHRLTTSVELIAQRTAATEAKVDRLGQQLQEMREEPGKRMISMRTTILTAILSNLAVAAITAAVMKLF